MTHDTKSVGNQSVCACGQTCWAYGKSITEPCWGEMHVSEDYPGQYTHFCDGHGHFEDNEPYKSEPIETSIASMEKANREAGTAFLKAVLDKIPELYAEPKP